MWTSIYEQTLVDHRVARATLQQPKAYYATNPPHWANARKGHTFRHVVVRTTTPPHPYKPLGFCARPLPHHQVTFCPCLRVGAK